MRWAARSSGTTARKPAPDLPLKDYMRYSRIPDMEGESGGTAVADGAGDGTHTRHDGHRKGPSRRVRQPSHELYAAALETYPTHDTIDVNAERALRRKLDLRILPLLGVCYFFYVRRPTMLASAPAYAGTRD